MSSCREYVWSTSNKELKWYFAKLDTKKICTHDDVHNNGLSSSIYMTWSEKN